MKKYFLLILILNTTFFYSQTQENEIKISEVSLPSAQAFEMTKRGSVPVDESSGRLGLNIPLGNLIEGEINVPISLSYSGPGVKMSDVSTWTGTNWNLNAGGAITRIVKDLPDDFYEQKIYDLLEVLGENPSNQLLTENQYKLRNGQNYDSQYDIFNFSFLNYSGEFVIKQEGENLIPLIVKNTDNLKIEIIGTFRKDQDYEFVITDTNGMKFYFGGELIVSDMSSAIGKAIEETQIADNPISNRRNKKYKSAFYLTKIESYKGDVVYFEYFNEGMYKNYFLDNQYIDHLFYTSFSDIPENLDICSEFQNVMPNYSYNTRFIDNRVFNGKFLRWIRGASGKKIIFNSLRKETPDLTNFGGPDLLKYRVLTDVIFNDKKIKLEYYPSIDQIQNSSNNYDRFFLKNVLLNDLNNQNNGNNYKLEYENLEQTPLNFNLGQDHMGYFNGHTNNQSLLPKNSYKHLKKIFKNLNSNTITEENLGFNFENHNFLGDREPDFNYAKYGSLKKIIYPEKGWTEFEYEPVILDDLKESKSLSIFHKRVGTCKMKDEFLLTNFYVGIDDEIYSGLMPTQDLLITINMDGLKSTGVNLDYHDFGRLKITNQSTNEITIKKIHLRAEDIYNSDEISEEPSSQNNNYVSTSSTLIFEFNNSHVYKFELEFGDENYGGNDDIISSPNSDFLSNINVNINFEFITGLNLNQGLGLRVKRVKDYDNIKPIPEIKRYYYKSFKDIPNIYFDNKVETFNPFYFDAFSTDNIFIVNCDTHLLCDLSLNKRECTYYNYFIKLTSNSILNNLPSQSVSALYKTVTVSYGGDDFENGGIEKHFTLIPENYAIFNIIKNGSDCQISEFCSPFGGVQKNVSAEFLIYEINRYSRNEKSNIGANNGKLVFEKYFINKNGSLINNKTIKFDYLNFEYESLLSFTSEEMYKLLHFYEPCIQNLFIAGYNTHFFKPFLKEVETVEYIDLLDYRQFISSYYHKGDSHKDFDNDGILNFMDEDYIITFEEYESDRKKITTKVTYDYSQTNMVNMANEIVKTSSDSSIVNKQKIYYPIQSQISLLNNLNSNDVNYYTSLNNAHRISQPIQMESFENNEKLTSSRLLFGNFSGKIMPRMVQKSKGQQSWFSTDEITNYDSKFNMSEIKNLETNIFTSFKYTNDGLPLCKVYNLTINQLNSNWSQIADYTLDPNGTTTPNANNIYDLFPNARFKFFKYDVVSRKLIEEKDENKQIKTYLYDSFFNLKTIKDHDGNIMQEFDQQFKPQN